MSIPKEPRQQMINIMYLVLTALLALNVSAEILNAFKILRTGIDNSNGSIKEKIDNTMKSFEAKVKKENRGQEFLTAAGEARKISADLMQYLDGLDTKLMETVGSSPETGDLLNPADQDIPTRLFVEQDKLGYELETKVQEYRDKFANLLKDPKDKQAILGSIPLAIDSIPPDKKDWATYTFNMMPAAAVRTLLSKFKNDAVSSEAQVIDKLYSKVGEETILYDKFQAAVIPSATHLIQGEKFEAKIYLAASSSMSRPVIQVGGRTLPLDPDGVAKYEFTASGTGEQTFTGSVTSKTSAGVTKTYPFTQKFTVSTPADVFATVAADKMNVFYIGVDNPVTVSASGVRSDKTRVSMTGGTLNANGAGGKYTVRVSSPGKASVTVTAETKNGPKSFNSDFRVKRIPDPVPEIGGKSGGKMGTGEFKAQGGMIAVLKDFDFDARFEVLGFEVTHAQKGADLMTAVNQGAKFNGSAANLIQQAKIGSIFYFDNIKVKGPDGTTRTLPTISFKIG